MPHTFHREYLVRLPLPLAQLYSRAHNAKDPRGRHDNTFYLFEALIKLAAAPVVACYLDEVEHGAPRVPALDRQLAQLALPSLGQWLGILRESARFFGNRPDAASHPLGRLWSQLDAPRRDLPGLLALYRRIKNGPDGQSAGDQSCSLLQLFDALVQYRNGVFGHGAGRFESFYADEMGPLLFPAADELLAEDVLDLLGPRGSRLVYLTEVRTVDEGRVEVGIRELIGLQGERQAALNLSVEQASRLLPNRVALIWPGRPTPLRLDPLLIYRESETAEEVLFLNRDRNGRQVEYLSYTTGRTERDKGTAPALAALLSRVVNREVSEADLDRLAQQSQAETPSVEALLQSPAPTGQQLGDYEIVGEIGRGGMGVVYLARQLSLGRLVALKMLPTDLAGDEVSLARFRREIRHLARCEHPNIVKVLASGTLPDGRLYYAMEYVPGCDLEQVWRELSQDRGKSPSSKLGSTTWMKAVQSASNKRSSVGASVSLAPPPGASETLAPTIDTPDDPGGYVRNVVKLIHDAALALETVHAQHVIHRDVKPGNLMLNADGSRIVLMDFGLAKGESLALTASKQAGFLGTLRYAAPEQLAAASLTVGPPADVRALGCVLWELLLRRRLFAEAEDEKQLSQRVFDEDVPRLRTLDPELDRDLEAIVARATERRAADRIQSAGKLAEYLQLWLDDKPLPIRSPSTAELVRRWVREHKAMVAAGSVAAAAVLVSLVGLSIGMVILNAKNLELDLQVQRANDEAALANGVKEFLQQDLLQLGSPNEQSERREREVRIDPGLTVRELVLRAAKAIEGKFPNRPLVEAEIRMTLGKTLLEMGRPADAVPQCERAREIYASQFGPDHHHTLHSTNNLAAFYLDVGRNRDALKLNEETFALVKAALGSDHPETLRSMNNLAASFAAVGRNQEALQLKEQTLALRRAALGPKHPHTLSSMNNLATSYSALGRNLEAVKLKEETLALMKATFGPDHPETLNIMGNLAVSYSAVGRNQEALKLEEETLALRRAHLGSEHPETLRCMNNLATSYAAADRNEEALKLLQETLALRKAKLGPEHPDTLESMQNLAISHLNMDRWAEALEILAQARACRERRLASEPANVKEQLYLAWTHGLIGRAHMSRHAYLIAGREFRTAVGIFEKLDKDKALTDSFFRRRYAQYVPLVARCAKAEQALADLDFALRQPAQEVPGLLDLRIKALISKNDRAGVVATAEVHARLADKDATQCYNAACAWSLASGLAKNQGADAAPLADQYALRALALLKKTPIGPDKGFKTPAALAAHMKQDKDMDPLRDRADFKAWLAELEK